MARDHWSNCITHHDAEVHDFVRSYFGEKRRRCLLVAAAGFDPRSLVIAKMLAETLGGRLNALFIREERGGPDANLKDDADANEAALREIVANSRVERVEIFGDDGAAVGGSRVAAMLGEAEINPGTTDIVLDMSALSIGIGFPVAKLLLGDCEQVADRAFHILIVSNPELDDRISGEPAERAMFVKGFSGLGQLPQALETAKIWIPQLAKGRKATLTNISLAVGDCYKICPVPPFPARDPRRADALIGEYENELVNEWQVDPRDIVYVSERNPLDSFRTISTLKDRYDRTVQGTYEPHMILSPIGSKVMAAGALMAAIEHDLAVYYIEIVRYEFDGSETTPEDPNDMMVHLLLSGPAYGDYGGVITADLE